MHVSKEAEVVLVFGSRNGGRWMNGRRGPRTVLLPWILPVALLGFGWTSASRSVSRAAMSPLDEKTRREIHRMVFQDRSLLLRKVREVLATYVDEPKGVKIELVPAAEPSRLLAGCFDEIRVCLEETEVKGLRIRHAEFRIRNAILDYGKLLEEQKFRFRKEGETDLLLAVRERDLNELFRVKAGKMKLRNPSIDLREDGVRFSGGLRVLFFRNHVKVAGQFVVKDGSQIYFKPRWMNLDMLPIPGFVLRTIARRINPIASFERFKFHVRLDRIRTTREGLYLATESMADDMMAMMAKDAEEAALAE